MKKGKALYVLTGLFFVAMLFLSGPVRSVWGQGEEKTKAEDTKEKFSEEKKEFQMKAKARLEELDRKINELEAKSKAEMKEDVQKLKKKRNALEKDLKRLEAKSRAQWEKAKQKVQAAMDDLEEAYNKILNKLK